MVIQYSTAEDGLDGTTRAGEGVDGDAGGGVDTDDVVGDDTGWVGADDCFSKTNFLKTWFSCFKAAFSDFSFSSCWRISFICVDSSFSAIKLKFKNIKHININACALLFINFD